MTQRLLEGEVQSVDEDRVLQLERENRELQRSLDLARYRINELEREISGALSGLRRQLTPLYRAMQAVFGEIDRVGVDVGDLTDTPAPGIDPRVKGVWESWKMKLGAGSAAARMIDVLLVHGEMTAAQLRVAAKMANQTVYDTTHKLNKLGLITKNGGRISLKQL